MAERAAAAIAGRHHLADLDRFERGHRAVPENVREGAIDRAAPANDTRWRGRINDADLSCEHVVARRFAAGRAVALPSRCCGCLPPARRGRRARLQLAGDRAARRATRNVGRGSPTSDFIAADGAAPAVAQLAAEGAEPKAVILALHGFNDYSNAFDIAGRAVGGARHRHLCLRPARFRRRAGARALGRAAPR